MNRKLVLAPSGMQKNLFSYYRQKEPFFDVKIITREELISSFYGRLLPEAKKEIMLLFHLDEGLASSFMRLIPFITNDVKDNKLSSLYSLKQKMISLSFYIHEDYLSRLYQGQDVEIYGYSRQDQELATLIKKLCINPLFHLLSDVKNGQNVFHFHDAREECFYALNEIASLLEKGLDPSQILLYVTNEDYLYYLEEFQNDFHFSINLPSRINIFSQNFISSFLLSYQHSHDLLLAREELNALSLDADILALLDQIIAEVKDERFSFHEEYAYLLSLLKKKALPKKIYDRAVNVISTPSFTTHNHIFVLGFSEGSFPSAYQDNDYLCDQQKQAIGINTSLDKGKMSEEILGDFFSSDNYFSFSNCESLLTNDFHPSPFIKAWKMNEVEAQLPTIFYSRRYAELSFAALCDLDKLYKEKREDFFAFQPILSLPYDTYRNQYSPVKIFDASSSLHYSYSAIKSYYACPFQYYVGHILKVDPFTGNFASYLGNIAHHLLQKSFAPGFDFDPQYQAEIQAVDYVWNSTEKVLLLRLKEEIKAAIEAVHLHSEHYMNHPTFYFEEPIHLSLHPHATIDGYIDKAIVLDNRFLVLIDYKTGTESFHPKYLAYGDSFQLPTYALMAKYSRKFQDYELIGLYINHLLSPSLDEKKEEDDLIAPHLKLSGVSISDLDKIRQFDSTVGDGKSSFIESIKINTDGTISKKSKVANRETFDSYIEIALCLYQEADQNIRDNLFPIKPSFFGNSGPCEHCSYGDICYLRYEQRNYIQEETNEGEGGDDNGF